MSLRILLLPLMALGAFGAFAACGEDALEGGVLASFDVGDESFSVWVTNEETIDQLLALEEGESDETIPSGWIRRGPGQGDHNEPWSWHLDPEDISMAEVTIEFCDGTPSYLEENLLEVMGTAGRFCPWSAELTDLEDHR